MLPSGDTTNEGPLVLGYAMCFGLMGVLSVQCFIYFTKFPDDRAWTKMLVAIVLLLETLITIFALHGFWVGVTVHDSDLSSIIATRIDGRELYPNPLWSFVALSALTGIVSSITHGFFSWRIWAVQRSFVAPVLTMMVSLLQCGMVTYGGAVYGLVPALEASRPMPFYIPVWLCGSLFCDLMITMCMTLFFTRTKSQFRKHRSLPSKLIKLTIETGLVTTTAAIVELVLAIAYRVTLYHMALFYVMSKLYANCLLATLNARLILRNATDEQKSVAVWEYSVSDEPSSRSHSGRTASHNMPSTAIHVHTIVETDHEFGPSLMDILHKHSLRVEGV